MKQFILFLMIFLQQVIIPCFGNKFNRKTSRHFMMMKNDQNSITNGIIIGGGRIGLHLYESNNKKDLLLNSRTDLIPSNSTGPIYVCTRNNDLNAIIENTPNHRKNDLIFLQNGILTNYLKSKELSTNTQILVYYAISKKNEKPIDGITDLNPDGLTAVTGIWANDFKNRMNNAGLSCHIYDKDTWTIAMLEKHIWICAFMAIGAKYSCTVGDVVINHNVEIRALISELVNATAKKEKVVFPSGVEDRLCSYARSVAHFPTALKEFEWRNGYYTDITFSTVLRLQADPCPIHTQLMSESSDLLLYKARKIWVAERNLNAKLII